MTAPETDSDTSEHRSGLRNPAAAVRGVGAGALSAEALVLVLAIVPLAKVGGPSRGGAIGLVVVLALVACGLIGVLRRGWAWWAGAIVPAALIAGGLLHWTLAALGVLFGLLWGYVLYVRRTVLVGRPTDGSPTG
jgi:hypothetical protein